MHDEFARRLEERARGLALGDEIGPLISERQRENVERLTPARRPDREGWFLEPTVVRSALPDEEIFGPVVTVQAFDGEEEAVDRANATEFGLAGGSVEQCRARGGAGTREWTATRRHHRR